jgi:hypothetical protein
MSERIYVSISSVPSPLEHSIRFREIGFRVCRAPRVLEDEALSTITVMMSWWRHGLERFQKGSLRTPIIIFGGRIPGDVTLDMVLAPRVEGMLFDFCRHPKVNILPFLPGHGFPLTQR